MSTVQYGAVARQSPYRGSQYNPKMYDVIHSTHITL